MTEPYSSQNYPSKDFDLESPPLQNNSHQGVAYSFYSALQLLPIRLPAQFDQSLGLQPSARWLSLYWEPQLNQVCYSDGETVATGNAQSWQVFCTHPQIEPLLAPYRLGDNGHSSQYALLLDRQEQRLYVGQSDLIDDYLRHPKSLDLLAGLDAPSDESWQQSLRRGKKQLKQLVKAVKGKRLWFLLGLAIIAIALPLLHEVGDFIFELPELLHD